MMSQVEELHRELERTRHDFQLLFDIVPCYISVQDRELRIIQTNELFRRDFGDRIGDHCHRAYKDCDDVCADCPVLKSFDDAAVHTSEEHVITADGERASVVVYSTPVEVVDGKVRTVMEVSTNVTEVKRLQALATIGLAVTGMAHRIKNILMGLRGGVYVVNSGFDTEDSSAVDEGWEMVERNVDKISHVARDLLFCSKDREPKLRPDVAPCAIVHEVHQLYLPKAAQDGIDLRLDVDPGRHTGTFDPEGLQNLVMNLVANAIDACRFEPDAEDKRHQITVACRRLEDGSTEIGVSDNGAGIPDEVSSKVFEGFFSTKGTEGTGLGLLVVQKVVEEHRGTIEFESASGKGTTFRVVLPGATRGT